MKKLNKSQLWNLRKEIVLNSLYFDDYDNSFGLDKYNLSLFFDGYLEFLEEEMKDNIENYDDNMFFEYLRSDDYDNEDNLYDWYMIIEDNFF